MTNATPAATAEGPLDGVGANAVPRSVLDEYGYVEEEWRFGGDAPGFRVEGEQSADGSWTVRADGSAPYRSRLLVRRPADQARFDGTVLVEWLNVSGGVDADPDFGLLHPAALPRGWGYVAVTAQQLAVHGGESVMELPEESAPFRRPLTERDPDRYATLSHPGDGFSYGIFAQAGELARSGALFGGVTPSHVIAVGESQSAFRLVSFVNAVQPLTGAFDGLLIHSRGAGAAPVSGEQRVDARAQPAVHIRADLDVPVLQVETETDLVLLRYLEARQPDTEQLVTWEIAGTAHADATILEYGRLANAHVDFDIGELYPALNRGPQAQVLRAGLVALVEWVRAGGRPPAGPPIEVDADGRLRRDGDGIVLGGIRTPDVDVPVATLTGEAPPDDPDNLLAQLFGETRPFPPERLAARYGSHEAYVAAVTASADAALAAGFLLPADRDAFVARAEETFW